MIEGAPVTKLTAWLAHLPKPLSPASSKLFFAFLTPYMPPYVRYTAADHAAMKALGPNREDYMPNHMRLRLIRMCQQLRNASFIRSQMPLYSPQTARRHYLLTPYDPGTCTEEEDFKRPGAPRVPSWVERAVLILDFDNLQAAGRLQSTQRALGLPYLSSILWDRSWEAHGYTPPWNRLALAGSAVGTGWS